MPTCGSGTLSDFTRTATQGGWQFRADQGLDSIPNDGIRFNLDVRLHEDPGVPGIPVTIYRLGFVVELKIPQNLGTQGIGSNDLPPAVKKSVKLVEIDGLSHVRRDGPVIRAQLRDTVHLDRQQDRDPILLERSSHGDSFRSTPAVSIEDDSSFDFFDLRERSIVVSVKHSDNLLVGLPPLVVLEYFDLHAGRVIFSQMVGELDFLMNSIVMVDESADESDHDDGR